MTVTTSEIPTPNLEFAYFAEAQLGVPIEIGSTPGGERRIIPVFGEGVLRGPKIAGRLVAPTTDWQVTRPDGVTLVDATYAIRTDDGVVIQVRNRGIRRGPSDVLARIADGDEVDPAEYYFRTTPQFEAPAGRYDWLNRSVFVCSGARSANGIRLRCWRVT